MASSNLSSRYGLSRVSKRETRFSFRPSRVSRLICLFLVIALLSPNIPNLAQHLLASLSSVINGAIGLAQPLPHPAGAILLPPAPRHETMADRINRVSSIRITPHKLVAYIGESHSFAAVGLDASGEVVHGVRFDWDNSKEIKAQIDEAGRASFLQAGMT